LAVGAYWNFTLKSIAPSEPGTVTNVADVTAQSTCGTVTDVSDSSAWVVDIVLNSPGIEIIKQGPECVQVGAPIVWQFTVNNIGNINLTSVKFSDPALGISNKALPDLIVGASYSWTQNSNAPMSSGTVTNVGSVVASSQFGDVSDSSDSVSVSVVNPKISIQKGGPDNVEPGADIVWTFSIVNTGDTPLTNVVFNDPPVGVTLTYTDNGGVLAVGAKWEFTYTTVAPESGDVDNYAYVTALGSCGIQVRDDDDHTVEVESPCDCDCLLVTKTGTSEASPGDTVTWEYSLYNCAYPGQYPCMTNFWLHDEITLGDGSVVSIFDAYSGDMIPCANGIVYVPYTLMPGEWFKFSVTFTIPKDWTWCDDGEWMNNTFKAQACCAGGYARGEASWSTHITDCCSIRVEKFSNVDEAAPGDQIEYTLVITNTGMNRLCALKVWDKMESQKIDLGCDLDPCESVTYTFMYTVPADWNWCDNPHMILNEAGACAYCCDCGKWVKDKDCNSVDIIYPPQIEIIKTANVSSAYADPMFGNNWITYNITVRNIGPTPITCVHVVDEMLGLDQWICCLMPCCIDCNGGTEPTATLVVDDGCDCPSCQSGCMNTWYFEKEVMVPCDWSWCVDGDYLDNSASVSGWACGIPVGASDSVRVLIIDEYHLEIEKTAPEVVYQGMEVPYVITVRNAGSKTLTYIDVYDDFMDDGKIDQTWTIECLAPCESVTFYPEYTVPVKCCQKDYKLVNEVCATAWVRNIMVKDIDHACSWVMCPCSLDINVTAPEGAEPGQTVQFTAIVTNDGNITIVQMDVFAMIMSCGCHDWEKYKLGCIIYLNPGESKEFTFNYTIPTCEECCQSGYWLSYMAVVEGECGCSEKEVFDGDIGLMWVRACCAIEVEITGPECVEPGQTVIFTITATNVGVNDLCCVNVTAYELGWIKKIEGLMAGQSMSWDVQYTIPASWNHCDNGNSFVVTVFAEGLCCECSSCCKGARWVQDKVELTVGLYDPITLIVDKRYVGIASPSSVSEGFVIEKPVDSRPKPGQMVAYEIVVYNKGCLPLSCIEVYDDHIGYVGCIPCLLPCEQKAFKVYYEIPCNWTYCENGEYLVNTATAEGWACDVAVSSSDSETIMVNADHIVQVYKSGPAEAIPGQTITYQISVHNGGKQPLCNLMVADYVSNMWIGNYPMRPMSEMLNFTVIECLGSCEWYNFTVTYTVPENWTCMNGEWLFNWVTVMGKACWPCEMLCADDLVWTKIVDIPPTIEVEKYAQCVAVPGQPVLYNIVVTNPNCMALGCIEVEDEMLGYYYVIPCMQPFETIVIPVWFTVPADWSYCENGEYINNTVEVSGWACTKRVSDSAEHTLMIWDPMDLRINKTSDRPDGVKPGETITYTITVWNAGSHVLSSVMVIDEMLDFCATIECLMPCDSETYTLTYTVPEDWTLCCDGEYIENTVMGWALGCPLLMLGYDIACDHVCVKVIDIDESIRVWKKLVYVGANAIDDERRPMPEINPGDELIWRVFVKNTGRIALSCINVTDIMTSCQGGEWVLYDKTLTCCLAPCEETYFDIKFVVPEECCGDFMLTNSVTATAWAEDVFVSWSDEKSVMVQGDCDIEIKKTPVKDWYWSDEKIEWKITVKNVGENKLYCINVTDDLLKGGYWYIPELAVGQVVEKVVCDSSNHIACNESAIWVYNTASVSAKCCADGNNEDCCVIVKEATGRVKVRPVYSLDVDVDILFRCQKCIEQNFMECRCCPEPGDWVKIHVTVTNDGRETIYGYELVDTLMGVHEYVLASAPLKSGETDDFWYDYQIPCNWTFCDNGKYLEESFTAMACEVCPVYGRVSIVDSDCDMREVCGPQLLMTKDAYVDGELVTEVWPGDVVTYKITVKNVGEHSVSCIFLMDTVMIGMMPVYFQSDMICCLEPCTEYVWTFDFTVPEWYCCYGDFLCDKAIAMGLVNDVGCCYERFQQDSGYNPWFEMACASNKLFVHNEFHIEVMKINNFGSECAKPGDVIKYTIVVANVGTCSVTNIYVDDDMLGLHEKINCLMPCTEQCDQETKGTMPCNIAVFYGSYPIPKDWSACDDGNVIVNTVTVKGWQCGVSQTVSDTNYVYVSDPCDVRIYIDYPATAKSGETVTVTVTVKNEGSNLACGIKVCDEKLGLNEMIWCLAPCESVTFTRQVAIPACDGVTHYVNGETKIIGCCVECWDCPWIPIGVLDQSVMPKCCCVHDCEAWSIMIVCGCCGGAPVPV
jgi:uncharacterized repeat protein (TIGR01451 family)